MLEYNKKLIPRAKELRKEMTKQERHLWYDFLRHYPIKIYKQKVIDNYIVDFYCHKARLVIELDGSQHYSEEGLAYDSERTKVLNAYGLDVIRFTNKDIEENFNGVCEHINNCIFEKVSV
jgi:very-short-patch-repair endonuclease